MKKLLWVLWWAALRYLLSGTQGWAAGGSPCRCCWNTGRALPAQDKVSLLQITN